MLLPALVVAALAVVVQQLKPGAEDYASAPFLLGVLLMIGVFMPVISGMLYKIMPFLNWLHLQKIGKPGLVVPNMRQMISEGRMITQFNGSALEFGAGLLAGLGSHEQHRDRTYHAANDQPAEESHCMT